MEDEEVCIFLRESADSGSADMMEYARANALFVVDELQVPKSKRCQDEEGSTQVPMRILERMRFRRKKVVHEGFEASFGVRVEAYPEIAKNREVSGKSWRKGYIRDERKGVGQVGRPALQMFLAKQQREEKQVMF